ncbi:hypothetical protein C8F01DRAFT_1372158 [Mycena amicta]|nr:hypothetical protein C8F01DRAFT_1372158 [Mycena amicta]
MFTSGKAVLPCLSLLLALAAQTSAYAIPSRSLVARHHTNVVIVCDADSDCNGMTMAGPDALNNTSTLAVSASSILDVQISCATPANAGDAMECTGVAVAPGTAFDPTQSQIACSIPTGVGSDFSCTSSFATAAGTAAFNLGVQLNCDIPHDVGDVLNCVGNAMTAPARRGRRASEEEAPQDEGCPDAPRGIDRQICSAPFVVYQFYGVQ